MCEPGKRVNPSLPTGCADPSEFAHAFPSDDGDTFDACCVQSNRKEVVAQLVHVLKLAKHTLDEMATALVLIGRYTSKNETRIREVGPDTVARRSLDELLTVSDHITNELSPVVQALQELTRDNVGPTVKSVVLSGVTAAPDLFDQMSALFFDALGRFTHALQIDVAGFDIGSLPDVPEDSWFRSLRSLRRGSERRLRSAYAKLRQMGLISVHGMMMTAAYTATRMWVIPAITKMLPEDWSLSDPRPQIIKQGTFVELYTDGEYLSIAHALCTILNDVETYRTILPPFFRAVMRSYKRRGKDGAWTSVMEKDFEIFDSISNGNRSAVHALGELSAVGVARARLREQYARIDDTSQSTHDDMLVDDNLTALHELLNFFQAWVLDAKWMRLAVKPLCTVLLTATRQYDGQGIGSLAVMGAATGAAKGVVGAYNTGSGTMDEFFKHQTRLSQDVGNAAARVGSWFGAEDRWKSVGQALGKAAAINPVMIGLSAVSGVTGKSVFAVNPHTVLNDAANANPITPEAFEAASNLVKPLITLLQPNSTDVAEHTAQRIVDPNTITLITIAVAQLFTGTDELADAPEGLRFADEEWQQSSIRLGAWLVQYYLSMDNSDTNAMDHVMTQYHREQTHLASLLKNQKDRDTLNQFAHEQLPLAAKRYHEFMNAMMGFIDGFSEDPDYVQTHRDRREARLAAEEEAEAARLRLEAEDLRLQKLGKKLREEADEQERLEKEYQDRKDTLMAALKAALLVYTMYIAYYEDPTYTDAVLTETLSERVRTVDPTTLKHANRRLKRTGRITPSHRQ